MSGVYYGLSIIAIFVIIGWFVANDRIAPDKPTTGLLALKDNQPDREEAKAGDRPGADRDDSRW
jgi:hypothetical protein